MPSIEDIHLSNIIAQRNLKAALLANVDSSFYTTLQGREIFKFLLTHYKNPAHPGEVCSIELIKRNFPQFEFCPTPDSVEAITEELRKVKTARDLRIAAAEVLELTETDPFAAYELMQHKLSQIQTAKPLSKDLSLSGSIDGFLETMEALHLSGGLQGYPYPWQAMNDETMGIKDGEFIIFYGRPKSMKTWVILYIACWVYKMAHAKVLFYTREMTEDQIRQRAYAILAGVDYSKFKRWNMDPVYKESVVENLNSLRSDEEFMASQRGLQKGFIITCDRLNNRGGSVDSLRAKIDEYEPDIVFVDAMYLMQDSRTKSRSMDWKNMYHISQDLKTTATSYSIPIIGTNQAKQSAASTRGEDLTEQAHADAFNQDCDLAVRVLKDTKEEITLVFPGFREGLMPAFKIHSVPAINFGFKSYVDYAEVNAIEKGDSKEDRKNTQQERKLKRASNLEGRAKLGKGFTKTLK